MFYATYWHLAFFFCFLARNQWRLFTFFFILRYSFFYFMPFFACCFACNVPWFRFWVGTTHFFQCKTLIKIHLFYTCKRSITTNPGCLLSKMCAEKLFGWEKKAFFSRVNNFYFYFAYKACHYFVLSMTHKKNIMQKYSCSTRADRRHTYARSHTRLI